jgi:hypothetical protein
MYPATAATNATYELPKLDPRRRKRTEKRGSRALLTGVLGNISASSFLYRLTGRRELGRSAGQHTHMLSHDGRSFAGRNPMFSADQISPPSAQALLGGRIQRPALPRPPPPTKASHPTSPNPAEPAKKPSK